MLMQGNMFIFHRTSLNGSVHSFKRMIDPCCRITKVMKVAMLRRELLLCLRPSFQARSQKGIRLARTASTILPVSLVITNDSVEQPCHFSMYVVTWTFIRSLPVQHGLSIHLCTSLRYSHCSMGFSAYECLLPHRRKMNTLTSRSPMKITSNSSTATDVPLFTKRNAGSGT